GEQTFLEKEGVLAPGRSTVLGAGSISGVDSGRFRPDAQARAAVRRELDVRDGELLVMYVGRLARDKGVVDLARATSALEGLHLALVGPDEDGLKAELDRMTGKISFVGYSTSAERWLAAADIACLPSRREGFGVALIE